MADNHNVNARLTSIHRDVLTQLGVTTNDGGTVINSTVAAVEDLNADLLTSLAPLIDGTQVTQIVDSLGNVLSPNGTPYLESVEITRPSDISAYTALDAINRLTTNVAQVETITLSGTPPEKQVDTVTLTGSSGTAEISGTAGIVRTVTFATGGTLDLTQTAHDFYISHAANYLVEGIVVTASGEDIIFTAENYGEAFVSPVITNVTGDLAGTVANTQANVVVGEATITGTGGVNALVSFDIAGARTLVSTAALFASSYVADYASEGIDLTSSGPDIIFTAASPGTPFVSPIIQNTVGDLTGTLVSTTPNDIVDSLEFENMTISNGGSGFLMDVKIESDIIAIAGTTLRIWFYNEEPSAIGDNVAYSLLYAIKDKRLFYVDVEMEAQVGASTSIIGQTSVLKEYKCADTSLFAQVLTIEGFTPTSGGKIDISLSVLKLS